MKHVMTVMMMVCALVCAGDAKDEAKEPKPVTIQEVLSAEDPHSLVGRKLVDKMVLTGTYDTMVQAKYDGKRVVMQVRISGHDVKRPRLGHAVLTKCRGGDKRTATQPA